jgi:hypothetical protein
MSPAHYTANEPQTMGMGLRVPLYKAELEAGVKPSLCVVTGGSSYIASPIIQRLLAAGHTVHVTVRTEDAEQGVQHLQQFSGASRLKIFKVSQLFNGRGQGNERAPMRRC